MLAQLLKTIPYVIAINAILSASSAALTKLAGDTGNATEQKAAGIMQKIAGLLQKAVDFLSANLPH